MNLKRFGRKLPSSQRWWLELKLISITPFALLLLHEDGNDNDDDHGEIPSCPAWFLIHHNKDTSLLCIPLVVNEKSLGFWFFGQSVQFLCDVLHLGLWLA
jgi:hypothetical protein